MKIVIVVLGPSMVIVKLTLVTCFQIAWFLVEIVKQVDQTKVRSYTTTMKKPAIISSPEITLQF